MAFPSTFTANAHILAPTNRASQTAAVLDRLEQALREQDAHVVHRGDDYLDGSRADPLGIVNQHHDS